MTPSAYPDASAAPPFAGPTPPDRVQMSLEQHCDGLAAIVAQRPPTPAQMEYLAATFANVQQTLQGYANPQGADAMAAEQGQQPGADSGAPDEGAADTTRDYGDAGAQDYGA